MEKFKESNPEEAAALEVELTALFAKAGLSTNDWPVEVFDRYPSKQQFAEDAERSLFIHDLFEQSGFRVCR